MSPSPWILGFRGTALPARLGAAIREQRVSGLILFRDNLGGSLEAARALRREVLSHVPPGRPFLFLIDEEGGLISQTSGLLLPSGRAWPAMPTPRALGRIGRPADCRWVGRRLGHRIRLLGLHLDLAPSLDLDTEVENPVIGSRSFGPDPEEVALLGWAFAQGLADAGIGSCFKHFPGHGGTRLDSHLVLPSMDAKERGRHALPFRLCLNVAGSHPRPAGSAGARTAPWPPLVMSAHVDWGDGRPASLSRRQLAGLGRWSPGSLVITDALDMEAVSRGSEAAIQALRAGNDLLLFGRDWKRGLESMAGMEAAAAQDAAVRRALRQSSRRILPLLERSARMAPGRTVEELRTDLAKLRRLHREAARLSASPEELPKGNWVWILPEGLSPYARLREWNPPAGRRRVCQEVVWVPEKATGAWTAGLAERLRSEARPILLGTLFRGLPDPDARRAWRPLAALPGVRVIAHLLDEGWPAGVGLAAVGPADAADRARPAVAFTSGPSREALTGLAQALDLPSSAWAREPGGLYFPIDT